MHARRSSLLITLSFASILALSGACTDDGPATDSASAGSSDDATDTADTSTETGEDIEPVEPFDEFPGLSAEVEILVDTRGIPHIYGQTNDDVGYASGYHMASERLFQMAQVRRRALGRQAEVFGPEFIDQDIVSRTLGWVTSPGTPRVCDMS